MNAGVTARVTHWRGKRDVPPPLTSGHRDPCLSAADSCQPHGVLPDPSGPCIHTKPLLSELPPLSQGGARAESGCPLVHLPGTTQDLKPESGCQRGTASTPANINFERTPVLLKRTAAKNSRAANRPRLPSPQVSPSWRRPVAGYGPTETPGLPSHSRGERRSPDRRGQMRKDVREFIRRLEAVGPHGRVDARPLPRPPRREAAPKAERHALHAPVLSRHDPLAQSGDRRAPQARHRPLERGHRVGQFPRPGSHLRAFPQAVQRLTDPCLADADDHV